MVKTLDKKIRAIRLNTPPKSKTYLVKELKALLKEFKNKNTNPQKLRSPPTNLEKAMIIEEYPLPIPHKKNGKIILPHLLGDVSQETCPKKTKPTKTKTKK